MARIKKKIKIYQKEFKFYPMEHESWQFILPNLLCFAINSGVKQNQNTQLKNSFGNYFAHFACNTCTDVLYCQTILECSRLLEIRFGIYSWSIKQINDLTFAMIDDLKFKLYMHCMQHTKSILFARIQISCQTGQTWNERHIRTF